MTHLRQEAQVPPLVTSRAAADALKVSVPTLTRWVKRKVIKPAARAGESSNSAYLFTASEVERVKRARAELGKGVAA